MGCWVPDGTEAFRATLYTREPDIVLALFNSPFGPDVLVTTDRLSEGVDLHRCCRHLIHYELDPSPVRTLQRNGRIRRVGGWASLVGKPIEYAYPSFRGTRDARAVEVMTERLKCFDLLLGGVPTVDVETDTSDQQSFVKGPGPCREEAQTDQRAANGLKDSPGCISGLSGAQASRQTASPGTGSADIEWEKAILAAFRTMDAWARPGRPTLSDPELVEG